MNRCRLRWQFSIWPLCPPGFMIFGRAMIYDYVDVQSTTLYFFNQPGVMQPPLHIIFQMGKLKMSKGYNWQNSAHPPPDVQFSKQWWRWWSLPSVPSPLHLARVGVAWAGFSWAALQTIQTTHPQAKSYKTTTWRFPEWDDVNIKAFCQICYFRERNGRQFSVICRTALRPHYLLILLLSLTKLEKSVFTKSFVYVKCPKISWN